MWHPMGTSRARKRVDQMTAERGPKRLSVVIPNFNHGSIIAKAIQAIAAQISAEDEIIVVDDGSTDNSLEVLKLLQEQYPPLRVVALEKNQGAIFALNRGLHEARGTYVNFGAADDVVLPGMVTALFAVLASYPQAAFACCECTVLDLDTGGKAFRPPVRPSYVPAFLNPSDVARVHRHIDNWILTGASIARRDAALEAGGFDASLGSFADGFLFRRMAFQHGCCFVPHMGLVWQVNSKGLSRSQAADPAVSMRRLATALERMHADPAFPIWYPGVFERRWRFAIGKIAADAEPMNSAVLTYICRGPVGRAVLRGACTVNGSLGRFAALAWLSLQERPTSYLGLVRTWLSRRPALRQTS